MTQDSSEFIQRFLRIVIFIFSLFLATAAKGHIGLPSHINLKQHHLQIILIQNMIKFCSAFHEKLALYKIWHLKKK